MKEKKADLEQLLNSLIKKGWEPFGWGNIKKVTNEGWFCSFIRDSKKGFGGMSEISHRELVSKESGLWQFVCMNGMVEGEEGVYWHKRTKLISGLRTYDYIFENYWIIESALCDEDELEEFLLSNIKVEGK